MTHHWCSPRTTTCGSRSRSATHPYTPLRSSLSTAATTTNRHGAMTALEDDDTITALADLEPRFAARRPERLGVQLCEAGDRGRPRRAARARSAVLGARLAAEPARVEVLRAAARHWRRRRASHRLALGCVERARPTSAIGSERSSDRPPHPRPAGYRRRAARHRGRRRARHARGRRRRSRCWPRRRTSAPTIPASVPRSWASAWSTCAARFSAAGVGVEIVGGGEVDIYWAQSATADDLRRVSYGQRGTDLLVETPYGALHDRFEQLLFQLRARGHAAAARAPGAQPGVP